MTNQKNTKRALYMSVLSMMLCIAMLIGSTFAWFTDNATTNVNTIQAGTLDIKLLDGDTEDAKSLEGKTLAFAKAEGHEEEAILFEPGAKYALDQVWLHNAGNLHANYQVVISGIDGSAKLANVLEVSVDGEVVGTLASLAANGGIVKEGTIAPGEYQTFGTINVRMQRCAGNEYQGESIEGIAITVNATQAPVEYDSYDNQYDAKATYNDADNVNSYAEYTVVNVSTSEELNAAMAEATVPTKFVLADGTYTLAQEGPNSKDLVFTGSKNAVIKAEVVYPHDTKLTFDGVTVQFPSTGDYYGFRHAKEVIYRNCTITGQQFMYAADVEFTNCTLENKANAYCVWTYAAENVTFTNCTFNTSGKAILVYNEMTTDNFVANITVRDCTFNDDDAQDVIKAAVETGSNGGNTETSNKYNLTFDCSTVNGFAVNDAGISTDSALWANKNSMDADHLNVVIDGVDVY